jgi:hypothetical protein
MRRTEHAENSPMIGITFSLKAASIYKRLGDIELDNKCLSVLGKFLELESPEWHESVIELSPEENAALNEKIKDHSRNFSISILERISLLAKLISLGSQTIYTPCALASTIKNVRRPSMGQ